MYRPATRPFALVAALFLVAAADGCGGSKTNPGTHGGSDLGGSVDAGPIAPSCTGKTAQASGDWMIMSGGLARSVTVHIPASYDPKKGTALILNFHGYSSNAFQEVLLTKMNDLADSANFVVIYPEGTGMVESWNAGTCCGDAVTNMTDDIAFTKTILDTAESTLCVDTKRIYVAGMSNGGFMTNRIGCELADRVAAIAPVAGMLVSPTCAPSRPMPVMHFHGTSDMLVPYNGDPAQGFISVPDDFAAWAMRDQCTGSPVNTFSMLDSSCSTYQHCAGGAEVTLCTVTGGGHTWPGGLDIPMYGTTTHNLDATSAMWTFFKAHPLP